MTTIEQTALRELDQGGRLLNAVFKAPTGKSGRFGFRGDIALQFQQQVADEKRPPEFCIEQVLTFAEEDKTTLPALVGYLHSFAYLKKVVETLDPALTPNGIYIMFCDNIDLLSKYQVSFGEITFHVLPLDESTVWKETLDLMGIDKNDIKKLDTGGKLDYVMDATLGWDEKHQPITYEEGLKLMGPVRNRNENRPV